jgi:hypothetical protein
MTRGAIIVVIALVPLSLSAKQDSQPVPDSLASLHEISLDITSPNGIIANSCISIQTDGHFHLESRWQQLPTPSAILHIYEGSLDDFQLRHLKSLLDSPNIKGLGPYPTPGLPFGIPKYVSFDAHVAREDHVQNFGYFVFDERREKSESIPESVKEQWRVAQTTLIPLVGWFHEIEMMKWPEVSASTSNFCNIDPPATN